MDGRRHILSEVPEVLEKMHELREKARQPHNALIQRP